MTCAAWWATTWPPLPPSQVYEAAGIGPDDLDVVELHDCFTANELITYEAWASRPRARPKSSFWTATTPMAAGRHQPLGRPAVQGPPAGATGLAQCAELVWQLRGQAEQRQVEGARLALQHNLGLGGACVVTLYQKM
jgi:acetyl-CoA acetyltransferase